jgi:hypothetical protein
MRQREQWTWWVGEGGEKNFQFGGLEGMESINRLIEQEL